MFHGIDLLTDESHKLLRNTVYQFAKSELCPRAQSIDESNEFPRDLWPLMGELGLHGITAPEAYGGAQMGYLAHVVAMEEISRASASVGLSYGAHSNLCLNQLVLNANEEQKQRFLPELISGESVGALAMSETGAGSDVMSMATRATPKDSGFVLRGRKMWITNGPDADCLITYARTSDENADKAQLTAFIVTPDLPGFSSAQKLDKLGMRGSNTCEILLDDVFVPEANILGEVNKGSAVLMSGLDYERLVLAAGPIGIMQACCDLAFPYVHERKQFGKSIGEFEFIQGKLADMYTALSTSRAYLYAVANGADKGSVTREDAASVILYAAECATQMALQTIQCLGGNGYINDYAAGRLLRDAKLYEIGAGTSEIRRMLIGRELFTQMKTS